MMMGEKIENEESGISDSSFFFISIAFYKRFLVSCLLVYKIVYLRKEYEL